MSSPIPIARPSSSSSSSNASRYASSSTATSFTSSSSQSLIYTRDALLTLGTSPLSQSRPPAQLRYFPEIVRKTRRGVIEAYQALDYARTTHAHYTVTLPRPLDAQRPAPVWRANTHVPRARCAEPELQRAGLGRETRTWNARAWMGPAHAIQVQ